MNTENRNHKDFQKKKSISVGNAHVLAVLSRCKIVQNDSTDEHRQKELEDLLRKVLFDLDKTEGISQVLQSLKFSDRVFIYLDFDKNNISGVTNCDALGWYNQAEGELLIGAKDLLTNERDYFMGVLAHELTHWCMQTVFKNRGFPYFEGHPNLGVQEEFDNVILEVREVDLEELDCVISSVFLDYETIEQWRQELIVRIPHLFAERGINEGTRILNQHPSTRRLLHFYETHVLEELIKFVSEGDLERSRETVYQLNEKLGLLQLYQESSIRFQEPANISVSQSQGAVISVCSSSNPYLTFLRVAWSLHNQEKTDRFYKNKIFCDFKSFIDNYEEVLKIFGKLEECRTLLLVCPEDVGGSYVNLFSYLKEDVFDKNPDKKVVLFIDENKLLGITQKNLGELSEIVHEFISVQTGFEQLDDPSRAQILSARVTINDVDIELQDLVGQDGTLLTNGNFIERFILKENIILSTKHISWYDRPPSFVSFYERLSSCRLLELIDECATTATQSFPTFALVLEGNLKDYPKVIDERLRNVFSRLNLNEILLSSYDDFEVEDSEDAQPVPIILVKPGLKADYGSLSNTIVEQFRCKLCYFVNVKSPQVIYCDLMFYPEIAFHRRLQRMGNVDGENTVDQDEFIAIVDEGAERIIVLSDNAGTGKTQFLNLISESITDHWIIKFSLRAVAPFIDDHPLETNLGEADAMRFIIAMTQIDDEFAEDVLRYKLYNSSGFPLLLLLDGMDEITNSERGTVSQNKNKVGNFIWFLEEKTQIKVVLVSRAEPETDLCFLNCSTYSFAPMSMENGQAYLEKLYTARDKLFPSSTLGVQGTMDEVRNFIPEYIGESLKSPIAPDFLKNPLHISMVSEILIESVKNGQLGTFKTESKGYFGVDKLYERIINIKYKVYYKEKKGTVVDVRLEKHCNSVFQHLALFYLFGNDDITRGCFSKNSLFKHDNEKFSLNIEEVSLYYDIGIVSSSPSGVDFIHRTYAEYFASILFVSWTDEVAQSDRIVNVMILNPERCFYFFESMVDYEAVPEDVMASHGKSMTELAFVESSNALKHHIYLSQVNVLKFIFHCWKKAEKFHVILDFSSYSQEVPATGYPLYYASRFGERRIVEYLIKEGFDINYELPESQGSVIGNIIRFADVELIASLFEKEDIKSFLITPNESLIRQIFCGMRSGVQNWIEWLGYGSKPDVRFGDFFMVYAMAKGELSLAKWLKNNGIKLQDTNFINTAIHFRKFEMIEWIVSEGVDLNASSGKDRNPLHQALFDGMLDMVQFLWHLGANVNARPSNGFNPLMCACTLNKPKEDLQIIQWLVDQGCNFVENTNMGTPLQILLIYSTNDECVEWALGQVADIRAIDGQGKGYLHYAAYNRKKFLFQLLIQKGCDVNGRDKYTRTAAHDAIATFSRFKPFEHEIDSNPQQYIQFMLDPFKLLVTKMSETEEQMSEELLVFACAKAAPENSFIFEAALHWLVQEVLKRKQNKDKTVNEQESKQE